MGRQKKGKGRKPNKKPQPVIAQPRPEPSSDSCLVTKVGMEIILKHMEYIHSLFVSKLVSPEDICLLELLKQLQTTCAADDRIKFSAKILQDTWYNFSLWLRQLRPEMSKDDALWFLVINDFDLGKPNAFQFSPGTKEFSLQLQGETELKNIYKIPPLLKTFLKRDVFWFFYGMNAHKRLLQTQGKDFLVVEAETAPESKEHRRIEFPRLSEMNAVMSKLRMEKEKLRAELEASKLIASEVSAMGIEKEEKMLTKNLQDWERLKAKLEQEISDEKKKILEIQEELTQSKQLEKETKVKLREELKAKEDAFALVEKECRAKEATEARWERYLDALRPKLRIVFQHCMNDLLSVEQEFLLNERIIFQHCMNDLLSVEHEFLLKESTHQSVPGVEQEFLLKESTHQSVSDIASSSEEKETIANQEGVSEKQVNGDRDYMICTKREVAHQLMCARYLEALHQKLERVFQSLEQETIANQEGVPEKQVIGDRDYMICAKREVAHQLMCARYLENLCQKLEIVFLKS